ncbi:SpoIIE family protein phosphatase [Streptomyces sp. DSM 44917]|uniref:SpoIIE family protein phosphatase n=1 Tax=Streptomyces boetiae TaxID=3075541 RepID=A0ABU2LEB5_9ACTN|nr:SpoIIE family protein phosphatase [Streptomyces sp. DSM 44917]MDT0309598.1 SpoIIE family protein phosphatase [Streptomyces sp. DSM 44917]
MDGTPARPADDGHDQDGEAADLVRGLLTQDRLGVAFLDQTLRITRVNDRALPDGLRLPVGGHIRDALGEPEGSATETDLRRVLETGVPLAGRARRLRIPGDGEREVTLRLSAVRLLDRAGDPTGVSLLFRRTAPGPEPGPRNHQDLRRRATTTIGSSLDVQQVARDLVELLVPEMADLAAITLAEAVLRGDEPPRFSGGGDQHLRRVAVAGDWPAQLTQVGEALPPMPDLPDTYEVQRGGAIISVDRATAVAMLGDAELVRRVVPEDGHSVVFAPLHARGLVLGAVVLWRTAQPEPFTDDDVELLRDLFSRTAIAVDNARRYAREHRAASALQQRLLPQAGRDVPAAETMGGYVPAGGGADIGGDWFDVIPLPSLRVALVIGDVIGHGMHATATMGRLRTAVQTLADLDLSPDELLTRVDDLVLRLSAEAGPDTEGGVGGTLLYAVYDPVTRCCSLATAGHPPPLILRPDGAAELVPLDPGPMLGVGGMPFEVAELKLRPDSVLALYSDGLAAPGRTDPREGAERLARGLEEHGPRAPLADVAKDLMSPAARRPPADDATLLLARVRALPEHANATWEVPDDDPMAVARVRRAVTERLAEWDLEALAFSTELIVSELMTNAHRHARGPYGVRLLRDSVLVCEVSDRSNTQPRMRRARTGDEGGRGLFLVAQLASRWGSRYAHNGKTVWAEQPLPPAGGLNAFADAV